MTVRADRLAEGASLAQTWTTRVFRLRDVSMDDRERWKAVADRAIEPNVYLDPRFLAPAGERPDARDIRILFVECEGDLRGVLQFSVGRLEDRWPVRIVTTGGAFMSVHADRHHPLVAPEQPGETVRQLLLALRRRGTPRLLLLRYLPADGPLADAFQTAFTALGYRTSERSRRVSAFALGDTAESTSDEIFDFSHLSSSRAKAYRRRVRGLERDVGGERLELEDRSTDPDVIEDFLAFQAAGWKGDSAKGGGAFVLDPLHEKWYREVTRLFHADGDLLAPTLVGGNEVVFQALDLASGGAVFGFIDAYNEKFAQHGPGTLGRLAEAKYITSRTAATHFDPAFDPRYSESTKLYPDRREHVDVLVGRGAYARAVLGALPWGRRLRERLARQGGQSMGSDTMRGSTAP